MNDPSESTPKTTTERDDLATLARNIPDPFAADRGEGFILGSSTCEIPNATLLASATDDEVEQ